MNEALSRGPRPLPGPALWARSVHALLVVVESLAAILLVADLLVVIGSVTVRSVFAAPFVWSDDIARALLLAVVFLGAAAALARGENAGVMFFVDRLRPRWRARVDAAASSSSCWSPSHCAGTA